MGMTNAVQLAPAGAPPADADASPAAGWACLSIDVEEYFHCEAFHGCVHRSQWAEMQRRATPRLERIAALLERHRCRATFFVLGDCLSSLTPVLRTLVAAGHEIATHGENHQHLRRMTPQAFREDLRRARGRLEDALGVSPRGYRAPTFSITPTTAWALDVLVAEDFEYDASVFPIRHDRYGVPGAPVDPFWAMGPAGARILEFPPLTMQWGPLHLPAGGGGYLRLLPGAVHRRLVARRLSEDRPVMLYVHPWELDPEQPRMPIGRFAQWRHRVNLHTTENKLNRLMAEFQFDTASDVLNRWVAERRPVHYAVGDASASNAEKLAGATTSTVE